MSNGKILNLTNHLYEYLLSVSLREPEILFQLREETARHPRANMQVAPEQGICQGGVVTPLLANIALNGIEEIHPSVRYADDMVFFLKPGESEEKLLDKISQFLSVRGLKVSKKKTKLTVSTDGFDFLGWHFKVQQNGKFKCTPSAENFKAFRQKVRTIPSRLQSVHCNREPYSRKHNLLWQ